MGFCRWNWAGGQGVPWGRGEGGQARSIAKGVVPWDGDKCQSNQGLHCSSFRLGAVGHGRE